jgi:tRNA-uridine 2-sulfurtransferase
LRLVEEGRTLEAATVLLWPGEDRRSCCSPGAIQRARRTAAAVGVPFHLVDLQERFAREVVEPFVAGYLAGGTPNPCIVCNPVRLRALVELADQLGLARVATGHYARLVWRDGEPYVARGADRAKDQSYMLWAVPPDVLARLEFPLGELTKPQVREAAARAELPAAAEPESQQVCFAVDGCQAFLEQRVTEPREGDIVDRAGHVLGRHRGHWRYTIGQRRGLGLSGPEPLYVLERRPLSNEVVVGRREELQVWRVPLEALVDRGLDDGTGLTVQLRYRAAAVPVAGLERTAKGADVVLERPFAGAAPGQYAVFYRDDVVVGGGVVTARPGHGGEYDTVRTLARSPAHAGRRAAWNPPSSP